MAGKKKKPKKPRPDIVDTTMSLGDHLEELRARILLALFGLAVGVIVGMIFARHIFSLIQAPYYNIKPTPPPLGTLGPTDGITAYFKVATISGLILTSPWVFYQLWAFVAAGLYRHERRYVYRSLPFSVVLFITGALFFLFVVAPLCLRFFIGFNAWLGLTTFWTLQKYVSFITMLMLVFGLAFQTPIVIFILTRTGLVSIETLKKSRKYVFLAMFVIAAVVTPPDVVSQIMLGIPLYGLYEMGILLSWLSGRKRGRLAKRGDDGGSGPNDSGGRPSAGPSGGGSTSDVVAAMTPQHTAVNDAWAASDGVEAASTGSFQDPCVASDAGPLKPEKPPYGEGLHDTVGDGYPEPVYEGEPGEMPAGDSNADKDLHAPGQTADWDDRSGRRINADAETPGTDDQGGEHAGADGQPQSPADGPDNRDQRPYTD